MRVLGLAATLGLLGIGAEAVAAPPGWLDLPHYVCMQMTLTPEQAKDITSRVPLYAGPSRSTQIVAYANMTMAVREPEQPTNGLVEVLFTNGKKLWMEADILEPYHSLTMPNTRCLPGKAPDGLIDFYYTQHGH